MRSTPWIAVLGAVVWVPPPAARPPWNDPAPDRSVSVTRAEEDPGPLAASVRAALARIPLTFVENRGQWNSPARFVARRGDEATLCLYAESVCLRLVRREADSQEETATAPSPGRGPEPAGLKRMVGVNLRLVFEGSSGGVRLVGRDETPTLYHYFLGNDPFRWRTDVRGYGKVAYEGLYDGIDLLMREEDSALEYDLLLESGADLSRAVLRVEGASGPLRLDAEGTLLIDTALGEFRQPKPRAWEEEGGGRRALECSYRMLGENRFGFEAPGRTQGSALVVDPQLLYSTLLGGQSNDFALAIALDASGAAVVAGETESSNYPTTPGAFDTTFGGIPDAFVTRLPLSGGLPSYSTFLGGTGYDFAASVVLDATGSAVVAGKTGSSNFPTTPGAFDTTINGFLDAFVLRLPLSGGPPSYSTFLGGSGYDFAATLALDSAGAAVVVGTTNSSDFPITPGAFDTTFNGGSIDGDAFVTHILLSGGAPNYSSYVGGSDNDRAGALTLDAAGAAVVVGATTSSDFPIIPGAFDTTFNGFWDAFVTRLPLSVGPPTYSTFLGGAFGDYAGALALDATGAAVVAGKTSSSDFPTTPGAFSTSYLGGYLDAFVTRLPLSGGLPTDSTFLGGSGYDAAYALALDATGAAVVAGDTNSLDFPTTPGAFDTTLSVNFAYTDAFVTRLPLSGGPPSYSTFLGGLGGEFPSALALDATGAAVLSGITFSSAFPTTPGALDTTFNGGTYDAFVAELDLLPAGASTYGSSTPGCAGPLPIGVTSIPQVGNAAFAVICGNAPAGGAGLLGFSGALLATPIPILGVQIWIDLASPLLLAVTAIADPTGAAEVSIPIPALPALAGSAVYVQFAWAGPNAPPPCPPTGVSASNALEIVVQP